MSRKTFYLENIPNNWNVVFVKQLFNIGRGRVISQGELEENGKYPVYSSQTKDNGCLGYINTYDFDCDQITWTTDGANAGTIFLRKGKHNCTNVCGTLQLKEQLKEQFNLKYLKYMLEYSSQYHKRADTNGYKIMNNEMARIKIAFPKLDKQKKIANYLDKKIKKINRLIKDNKKIIELLEECKKSYITKIITKGLNNNCEFKESKILWIGRIPKHWEIISLKRLGKARNGLSYNPEDIAEKGTLVLRSSNIQNNILSLEDNIYVKKEISEELKLKENDLLICSRNGSRKLIGKNILIDSRIVGESFGAFMCVYRSKYNEFIRYALNSHIFEYYLANFLTSTINQLTTSNLYSIKIPFTYDLKEQKMIVNHLTEKSEKFNEIINQKRQIIQKLEEYKKSLIYEVVTGKVQLKG